MARDPCVGQVAVGPLEERERLVVLVEPHRGRDEREQPGGATCGRLVARLVDWPTP